MANCFNCGIFLPNVNVDTFQKKNCKGNPIGKPQDISKVVVLNTTESKICNIKPLANAIANAIANNSTTITQNYDLVKQIVMTTGSLTIPTNTIHYVSYKILEGEVDITIDGVTATYEEGECDFEGATTTIKVPYVFTPKIGGKIRIKTIY